MFAEAKSKLKSAVKYVLALSGLILPFIVKAQSAVQSGLSQSGLSSSFGTTGISGQQSVSTLIVYVINLMLYFAGAIAVVYVIIGGYFYVTSAGNEETAEKGRKTLVNAIIGIIIIIMAYAIINVLASVIGNGTF